MIWEWVEACEANAGGLRGNTKVGAGVTAFAGVRGRCAAYVEPAGGLMAMRLFAMISSKSANFALTCSIWAAFSSVL
jgi:hypothetical protein